MPYTVADARDLLIAATLSPDPVLYIDDRWLYDAVDDLSAPKDLDLGKIGNQVLREGTDLTLAGCSWGTQLAMEAAETLASEGVSAEVVDLRVLNPFDAAPLVASVEKTGRLIAIDASWRTCGVAGEAIARVSEQLDPRGWKARPQRVTLPDAPAPSSKVLEKIYYPTVETVLTAARASL
jgi:pyruvate dehydrogenase E1 component beta subunit